MTLPTFTSRSLYTFRGLTFSLNDSITKTRMVNIALISYLLCFASSSAYAWEHSWNIQLGADHSDNIERNTEDEQQEELETKIGTAILIEHQDERIDLNLNYNVELSNYKNDVVEHDTQFAGTTGIEWKILNDNIVWNFNHIVTEALANNRVPDTPDARETRNILTTGPRFTTKLSKVDSIALDLEYVSLAQDRAQANELNNDADDFAAARAEDIDSERYQGALTWSHALSQASSFNVSYGQSQTMLDQQDVNGNARPDFEFQRASVGYNVTLASGNYNVQIGGNRSKRENQNDYINGTFTSIGYTNDFGGRVLDIKAVRQLTDSSVGLGAADADVTNSNFDVLDIVERTNITVGYRFDNICRGCSWQIQYAYDEEDFQNTDGQLAEFVQDSEEHRIRNQLEYKINTKATANFILAYAEASFTEDSRKDKSIGTAVRFTYRYTEKLDLRCGVSFDTRDTSRSGAEAGLSLDYDELSFNVLATYRIK